MVPRWRSFANTLRSQELAAPRGKRPLSDISAELLKRLTSWRLQPSLLTAAELVESAIVEGQEPEAVRAATSLLSPSSRATPLLKKQAAFLLLRAGHEKELPPDQRLGEHETLKLWRERTRLNPRNAVAWVELARCQLIYSQKWKAERSMAVALSLAPNNRYVLRSASRLFLHLEQFDRAHDLMVRSPATRQDPWLLSAEIALSQVAEVSPKFYKVGLSMLSEANHLPRQITELAGAVATTELLDGSRKKAVRFFRQSIIDPNGNALAQAEWATPAFATQIVSEDNLKLADEAYEAKAFHLYRTNKFEEVAPVCAQWSSEEPFSIRPYEFGAQSASTIGDYETALLFARRGLAIRPAAVRLLNSAAFAQANLGHLDEAELLLQRVPADPSDDSALVAEANRGLVAFRRGNVRLGASFYKKAIDGFRYRQRTYLAASARLYYARETLRAGCPEGEAALIEARRDLDKYKFADLLHIAEQVQEQPKLETAVTQIADA